MPENNYPNSGALFYDDDKRSDKAPDFKGNFTLDNEVLDYIVRCVRANKPVKLEAAGWRRQGRDKRFISLKIDVPYQDRADNQMEKPVRNPYRDAREDPPRGQYKKPAPRPAPAKKYDDDLNDEIPWGKKEDKDPWDE